MEHEALAVGRRRGACCSRLTFIYCIAICAEAASGVKERGANIWLETSDDFFSLHRLLLPALLLPAVAACLEKTPDQSWLHGKS